MILTSATAKFFVSLAKILAKITLLSSFKCKPSPNKFSAQLLLLSINSNPFNFTDTFHDIAHDDFCVA